ncbi:MAG: citrate/2-methylcitrate synthase [Ilumatobacteraceae bacterium]
MRRTSLIAPTIAVPRALFTPTFAVSCTIGWTTHALEQAAQAKLIRPAARYVGAAAR